MRKVAANSIVLLRNEGGLLPLDPSSLKKVAIIGPNAHAVIPSGGGSASLRCAYVVTPFEGITSQLPEGVEVAYHEGCVGTLTFLFLVCYQTLRFSPLVRLQDAARSRQEDHHSRRRAWMDRDLALARRIRPASRRANQNATSYRDEHLRFEFIAARSVDRVLPD